MPRKADELYSEEESARRRSRETPRRIHEVGLTMSATPWFKFYPSDWIAGTRGLSAIEAGIYINLIAMMYDHAEPIREDITRLARMCGATPRQFAAALKTLIDNGKITRTDDGLWNDRTATELQSRDARIGKAKKAVTTRETNKVIEYQGPSADLDDLNDTTRSSIPDTRYQREEKEEPTVLPKRKLGTRIPIPFYPDPSCHAIAERLLLSIPESQMALENFEDYWKSVPGARGCKLDWQATFRNWLRQFSQRKPHNGKTPGNRPGSMADGWDKVDAVIAEARRRENGGGEIIGEENPVQLPGLRQGTG